ncbi:MAG: Stp1/IreP family PP2C-type Ser/Thr phosphatase [Proteobacteria bacterium]|nr:Stp1/IreP family PP2C-type Ser/Thr phosphatase [Pseudomonadota bacterium]
MILAVGAKTDTGMVRQKNEDNLCVIESIGLLVVADGMGGHASGEVASKIAVDVIKGYFDAQNAGKQLQIGSCRSEFSEETNWLCSAIRLANQAVFEASRGNVQFHGMGTTIAAVLITGKRLSIAHVGDSRVYLIRSGGIEQLTDDHSIVSEQVKRDIITREQARESEMKNILTRALGVAEDVEVDLGELSLFDNDVLLLCSDGLTNMVDDNGIISTVEAFHDPSEACGRLADMANKNGGNDNITVIIARLVKKKTLFYFLSRLREWFRR